MWDLVRANGFWQGEIWNRRKNGEVYPELLTISAVRNDAGAVINYIGAFTDITRIKQSEARLVHMAYHDPLTELPNRTFLLSGLDDGGRECETRRRTRRCAAARSRPVQERERQPAGTRPVTNCSFSSPRDCGNA